MTSRAITKIERSIADLYEYLKDAANYDLLADVVPEIVTELDKASRSLLRQCKIVPLKSMIPPKEYFVFVRGNKGARY